MIYYKKLDWMVFIYEKNFFNYFDVYVSSYFLVVLAK